MTKIPVKYKREGYKLAGTSLPLQAHNYLLLYSLAKGTTKSKILTNLINNWIKRQKEKESEDALLRAIIMRINSLFHIKKINNPSMSYSKEKQELADELLMKGLNSLQIEIILEGIKEKKRDGKN